MVIAQRAWAGGNPGAAYRKPLTMDEYLNAGMVCDPLSRYDCVPPVRRRIVRSSSPPPTAARRTARRCACAR